MSTNKNKSKSKPKEITNKSKEKIINEPKKENELKFDINITFEPKTIEMFGPEKTQTKYKLIKQILKYMLDKGDIDGDRFIELEKHLAKKLKNK